MTLARWKPFGDLVSMHDKINRLFANAFDDYNTGADSLTSWCPAADIYETKDHYVFKLEVPGLSKGDIDVQLDGTTLTVKGEKKEEKEVEKENFHRIESYSGKFSRSFTLPKNIEAKKVTANLKDGILELRIGKIEEKKAKAISINVK